MRFFISLQETSIIRNLFFVSGVVICFSFINISPSLSQENESFDRQKEATKVFLDVDRDYQEYVKTEIPFVNYVRDRKEAQVHILLTKEPTGSRGTEYTLTFIGQQNYVGQDDTLKCTSQQLDTEEIIRRNLVRTMKLGLIRYTLKTPLAEDISINYTKRADPTMVVDKWDYWVFNIESNGRYNAEESSKELSLESSFSADRVTPYWKMSLEIDADYNKEEYKTDDRTISSYTRSQELQGLVVKSRGEHWSAGFYSSVLSSIYSNTKFSYTVAPAIEFNVFPYSESTRRELRILYKIDYTDVRYNEETIFDEIHERLFDESLSGTLEIKEKWGSASTTLEGSHYFHDFSKNNLRLHCDITFRLFEGFSLNFHGNVSRIHNQLSLPKEDATEEEILLHQRQLETQYDYFASIGLRYTFGSIYSNVVNPRFGSGD